MRTQIALDAEQHALARQKAAALGVSLAEYIRRLVDRDLREADTQADLSDIVGLFDSGGSNIAVDRQRQTAEAILAHRSQR